MVSRVALLGEGTRSVVAGGSFVALIDSDVTCDLAIALGRLAVAGSATLDNVLDVLVGVPLRSLPPFALVVDSPEGAVAVVRGDVEVRVDASNGSERFDAVGFRTWRERTLPTAVSVSLGDGPTMRTATGWLGWGVTTAGSVTWLDVMQLLAPVPASGRLDLSTDDASAVSDEPPVAGDVGDSAQANEVTRDESWMEELALGDDMPDAEPCVVEETVLDGTEVEGANVDLDPDRDTGTDGELSVLDGDHGALADGLGSVPDSPPHRLDGDGGSDVSVDVDDAPDDGAVSVGDVRASGYDDLFSYTRPRTIEQAAVRAEGSAPGGDRPDTPSAPDGSPSLPLLGPAPIGAMPADSTNIRVGETSMGDHDGHTRSLASIQAEMGTAGGFGSGAGSGSQRGVAASRCPGGHLNPPHTGVCRVCGSAVLGGTEMVERAEVGVLVFPDGERVVVDRTVLIGRNPGAEVTFEGELPRLVRLADDKHLSRTHCTIRVSGWTATIVDRGSQNGTVIRAPGRQPELLRAGVPTAVLPGTEIVLAEAVTVRFEVA